jgi:signal transduction histidine kinase
MKGNLILTPENVQVFERTIEMLENSIVEMRQVVNNMIPETLIKYGLNATLKDLCEDINNSGKMQISYQSSGIENLFLDQTFALLVYRIAEQRINNILKEATAKNVLLRLVKQETKLTVIIDDDGNGVDTTNFSASASIGWNNIQKQIDFLKGTLDVHSKKEGTLVRIEISV